MNITAEEVNKLRRRIRTRDKMIENYTIYLEDYEAKVKATIRKLEIAYGSNDMEEVKKAIKWCLRKLREEKEYSESSVKSKLK